MLQIASYKKVNGIIGYDHDAIIYSFIDICSVVINTTSEANIFGVNCKACNYIHYSCKDNEALFHIRESTQVLSYIFR